MRVWTFAGRSRLLARFDAAAARVRLLRILAAGRVAAGGVGIAAYPWRRLTRRLEGCAAASRAGAPATLAARVAEQGNDEVAAVGRSFNRRPTGSKRWSRRTGRCSPMPATSCARRWRGCAWRSSCSEQSPRARERDRAQPRASSTSCRGDPAGQPARPSGGERGRDPSVDLLALAAEEAARTGAMADGEPARSTAIRRLLRRLIRNLLENAAAPRRAARSRSSVGAPAAASDAGVSDHGPGIPGRRARAGVRALLPPGAVAARRPAAGASAFPSSGRSSAAMAARSAVPREAAAAWSSRSICPPHQARRPERPRLVGLQAASDRGAGSMPSTLTPTQSPAKALGVPTKDPEMGIA